MSGTPGQPVPGQSYNRSPAFTRKYGQAQQVHAEYASHIAEPVTIRSWKIHKSDIATHGVTPGCPGCRAITIGKQPQSHTMECRVRIEEAIADTAEGQIRLTQVILQKDAPRLQILVAMADVSEKSPRIPRLIFQNVRRGSSDPRPPARADRRFDDGTAGSDDGNGDVGGHGPRDGLDSAHGPISLILRMARNPNSFHPRGRDQLD